MAGPNDSSGQSTVDNDVPAAMRKVYRRLERWRSQRTGRDRIPESLWAAAGALAREHGVNPVSRALHLEFNELKRVTKAGQPNPRKRAVPAFVELIAPHISAGRVCMVELEGRRGKLRIELKEAAATEVAAISRALWEMIA